MRLAVVVLLTSSSLALAQTPTAHPKRDRPAVQVIDIAQGAEVEGGVGRPVIDLAIIPEKPIFRRMLTLRGSFAKELHESVDALR